MTHEKMTCSHCEYETEDIHFETIIRTKDGKYIAIKLCETCVDDFARLLSEKRSLLE